MSSTQLSIYAASAAADEPAAPLPPSSAFDDALTTQPSRGSSIGAATDALPPASESNSPKVLPTSTRPQLELLEHRFATGASGRRSNDVIAAKTSYEASHPLAEFLLPPDLQDPILSARRYRVVKELGEGSYGKVSLAWDERRQRLVAVKMQHKLRRAYTQKEVAAFLKIFSRKADAAREAANVEFLQLEMAALKELHHENIVEWFHTIETTTDIYMVLEFCGGGTLIDYIKGRRGISEAEAKAVFVQLLSAILYMHSKPYCHRDLKGENVLISSTEPNLKIKLSDFGFSRSTYDPYPGTSLRRIQHMFAREYYLTPPYASPELLNKGSYNPLLNDLWALGVILYEMCYNQLPFASNDAIEVIKMQAQGVSSQMSAVSELPSDKFRDLVVGMLQYNVSERFVMRDVLLHHWIAREFVRYETRRLGLPDGSYRLPPEELTVRPYRLDVKQCNDFCFVHNLHHSYQLQYATMSLEQVNEIGIHKPKSGEGMLITSDINLGVPLVLREFRDQIDWSEVYKNTADFGAKDAVIDAIYALDVLQNLRHFNQTSAVQDAMTLLHAVLIFYRTGLCSVPQWDEICKEACVKLQHAIQLLNGLCKHLTDEIQQYSTQQTMARQISELQNDEAKINTIIPALINNLCKLDAIAELWSPGFVEQTLRKFSNTTGHFGLIDLNGYLVECTSDRRLIVNPHDSHDRSVHLAALPPRSLDDVRIVVADLLRGSVYADVGPTEAVEKAQRDLLKIRTFLKQYKWDNYPNISPECTKRLRELAEIEEAALKAYLQNAGHPDIS